ncbi:MAG: right-handed parallel beta-helix repeat-containing protein [Planctomycetota bacterium]
MLVAPGTYNESINFFSKEITLRGNGGAAETIIDASGLGTRVIRCQGGQGPELVLEGFTITGGQSSDCGGMYLSVCSPTIRNCVFIANTATEQGGGIHVNASNPSITNCTFIGNSARSGGGIYSTNSSPTLTNCMFSGNTASFFGGGMRNNQASPIVTSCTFSANVAEIDGGGMANVFDSHPVVTNSVFWMNSDAGGTDESGQIYNDNSFDVNVPFVSYSNIQGGWTGAGGEGNTAGDPLFVDADGFDDLVGTADDNLRLQSDSQVIDAGTNSVGTDFFDLDDNARVSNCLWKSREMLIYYGLGFEPGLDREF